MFSKEGVFIQRIGKDAEISESGMSEFSSLDCMCVVGNSLYVVDYFNTRIQVFI